MLGFAQKAVLSFLFFLVATPLIQAAESSSQGKVSASKKHVSKKATTAKASPRKYRVAKKTFSKKRKAHASVSKRGKVVKKTIVVNGRRQVVYRRVAVRRIVPAVPSAGDLVGLGKTPDPLDLKSNVALVMDLENTRVLFEKNSNVALPIASITKLMTGLVVIDAQQDMNELLEITAADIDKEKNSTSRLRIGAHLTRANMLHIALMSSENRAASALGRNYPGGLTGFVAAMNAKAKALGMHDTHYVDSSGLSSQNVATAHDLAKLVIAAHQEPILRQYSTDTKYVVDTGRRSLRYSNTNYLVKNPDWDIGLQKTGYISEAGRCLVMQTIIEGRSVIMVLLDSKGKLSRMGDAGRIRRWLEANKPLTMSALKQDPA